MLKCLLTNADIPKNLCCVCTPLSASLHLVGYCCAWHGGRRPCNVYPCSQCFALYRTSPFCCTLVLALQARQAMLPSLCMTWSTLKPEWRVSWNITGDLCQTGCPLVFSVMYACGRTGQLQLFSTAVFTPALAFHFHASMQLCDTTTHILRSSQAFPWSHCC